GKAGIDVRCLLVLLDRFVVPTGEIQHAADAGANYERQRIAVGRLHHFRERLVAAAGDGEKERIRVVDRGGRRIQRDRAEERALGGGPVPVPAKGQRGERRVRFGELVVELERLLRGGFRQPDALVAPKRLRAAKRVAIG